MKICKGCKTQYSDLVWISEEGLCSICYHIHHHSDVKEWDSKKEKWVKKEKGIEKFI